MIKDITLSVQVTGWYQTITHGEKWPQYQLRAQARVPADEELRIGPTGYRSIRNVMVDLAIVRDSQERPERGIGIIAHHPERQPRDDVGGMDEFIGGWFWMPDDMYNEVWAQAREHRYDACTIELLIAPIVYDAPVFRWDTNANKITSIMRAGVRFDRTVKPVSAITGEQPELAKKRWWLW